MLFNFLFSLASFIASLFNSIPITLLALSLATIPIVPVPQYKSKTVSSFFISAYSIALLYNFSACKVFTYLTFSVYQFTIYINRINFIT